jgi:hypothetical protein
MGAVYPNIDGALYVWMAWKIGDMVNDRWRYITNSGLFW